MTPSMSAELRLLLLDIFSYANSPVEHLATSSRDLILNKLCHLPIYNRYLDNFYTYF